MTVTERALRALRPLSPEDQVSAVARHLAGHPDGVLSGFEAGTELRPHRERLDGSVLDTVAARALRGERGAVFTQPAEAHLLAALGLARVAARRGGEEAAAVAALVGASRATRSLAAILDGACVLDPCCGGGALLVAALRIARRCGFALRLEGRDLAGVATAAAAARLSLLGADARVECADVFGGPWPRADLVLSNPPFLRHEAIAPAEKARAAAASGLSRQADLSAHILAVAIRHTPDVAVVWPRALDTARSAEPLLADLHARGGLAWRLRSRASGSFAASVDTALAVWSLGHPGRPAAEAMVPLRAVAPREVAALARGVEGGRLAFAPARIPAGSPGRAALRVGDVCEVRFGMKSGCNDFFHLRAVAPDRFESALEGEVQLSPGDTAPLLASLREALAPELATPARHLFRPARPSANARRYIAAGEARGVDRRPTCLGRKPWWRVAGSRVVAPVLYPAKIGARAFAVLNAHGWCEDKKWHALFPHDGLDAWVLATVLGATPVRLAVDRAARQLTGMQAIADVDCRVLAAAPFPARDAVAGARGALARCREALARDPVTTDVASMLARPAQLELDEVVGQLLGLSSAVVAAQRREVADRVAARLEHAAGVRASIARLAS